MGLGTQMNENERGVFTFHGLTGGLIAVALLLAILVTLTIYSIQTQKSNAENYYMINQDLKALKAGSIFESDGQVDGTKNHTMRKDGLKYNSESPFK